MEIVLQWLDELDDIVSTALLCWERLRPVCLFAGLVAAMLLCSDQLGVDLALPALLLANIAAGCVGVWSMMTVLGLAVERKNGAPT